MTAPLVFLDTETTGLALEYDIWEFAGIRRYMDDDGKGITTELHLFIEHDWDQCRQLPEPFYTDHRTRFPGHDQAWSKRNAAHRIAALLEDKGEGKPHVVGAVPNFDMERIDRLLRLEKARWRAAWHYHLIDVENLAIGYLAAQGGDSVWHPPWDSDALSQRVGVEPPGEGERHTAMGDARWAMRLYDKIMGVEP